MRLVYLGLALAAAGIGWSDTVTLRNGRVIQGTYLGGTARQVRIDAGDQIQTVDVDDISRIEFSAPAPSAAAAPPPAPAPAPRQTLLRPDPAGDSAPAPQAASVQLPAGTNIVVRMIDGVDSQVNRVGQTFAASLDEAVMLNGNTVIPRGADAVIKLADSKESGKLTGRTELTLDLVSVRVNGRMVDINTQTVSQTSASRGARTAKVAGGTAAVGAIIGAIAGGGKGAAIGAGAGAAAGAGAEIVTKGQRVKIPSETRLTFVMDTPVNL
ncbi:MAG TPA: hypothetical protein VKT49_03725 [Bryobacteraceae bacterium]|nr:hypothetical protein [Bryobacteraceae bacterium]